MAKQKTLFDEEKDDEPEKGQRYDVKKRRFSLRAEKIDTLLYLRDLINKKEEVSDIILMRCCQMMLYHFTKPDLISILSQLERRLYGMIEPPFSEEQLSKDIKPKGTDEPSI